VLRLVGGITLAVFIVGCPKRDPVAASSSTSTSTSAPPPASSAPSSSRCDRLAAGWVNREIALQDTYIRALESIHWDDCEQAKQDMTAARATIEGYRRDYSAYEADIRAAIECKPQYDHRIHEDPRDAPQGERYGRVTNAADAADERCRMDTDGWGPLFAKLTGLDD
jgi:hypothetical protein